MSKKLSQAKWLLIIGILLVVVAPILFTREFGVIDFSDTGQIGDTIGGITAPIVNLVGAILVFFALQAQIEANKIIQSQISDQQKQDYERKRIQFVSEQVNAIRNDILDFSHLEKKKDYSGSERRTHFVTKKGSEAFHLLVKELIYTGEDHEENLYKSHPKLYELDEMLNSIISLATGINEARINSFDKKTYRSILNYQFRSKIFPAFKINEKHRMKNIEPCEKCGKKHEGIPESIFEKIDEIDKLLY